MELMTLTLSRHMYCTLCYNLLFSLNGQSINSNVYFAMYCDMFRSMYIIFRESVFVYANMLVEM
jgi:hypothetical protein